MIRADAYPRETTEDRVSRLLWDASWPLSINLVMVILLSRFPHVSFSLPAPLPSLTLCYDVVRILFVNSTPMTIPGITPAKSRRGPAVPRSESTPVRERT